MKKAQIAAKKKSASFRKNQQEEAWLNRFVEQMARPNNAEEKFYAALKEHGHGVGLDHNGKLVFSKKSKKK